MIYLSFVCLIFMGAEEDLQAMINQTVELAISQKDAYFKEIEASNDILKINDPKEFVFALIMGQILAVSYTHLRAHET